MNWRGVVFFFLFIWAKVEASNTTARSSWTVVLKVFENCADKNDSLSCLQRKILNFASRMSESKSLEISEGIKFVRDAGGDSGRGMSESKSNSQGTTLGDQIWNEVVTFFKSHSVEVNIPKLLDFDNEGRGKKNKGYGGIILLAGAMKGAMIYMGMHAIAALAGKALIVAKIALTIASVIALKKLLEGSGGKTSYEIVKHPQHSYVQTHSSSHEYGGGGHTGHGGSGYEGHYRKRSIAKTKINEKLEPDTFVGAIEETAYPWKFEPPKDQPITDYAPNGGDEFYSFQPSTSQNQAEVADQNRKRHNLYDLNSAGKIDDRPSELHSENQQIKSGIDKEFSPSRQKRSLHFTKFVQG